MIIMKKFLLILAGLLALFAPQTASAQADVPISEKDSLRIVKIATQTSRLHYEAATEVGFKMDHCQAIRLHLEFGYRPVRCMHVSFGYNYGMLSTPVGTRSSHELMGLVGTRLWKKSPLELRAGAGHTVGHTMPKAAIVRGELNYHPGLLFFGVGYQYNFTKKSVIDNYGGLYLKLGISI